MGGLGVGGGRGWKGRGWRGDSSSPEEAFSLPYVLRKIIAYFSEDVKCGELYDI